MSSTTKTQNYNLSQFADTDKPTWRGDYNGDMLKIDRGMQCNANAAADAHTAARNAQSTADSAAAKATENAAKIEQVETTANKAWSLAQTNEKDIATTDSQLATVTGRLDSLDALVATKKTTPPQGWQVGSHVRAFHPAEASPVEFKSTGVRVHYRQQSGNGVSTWCTNQDDDLLLSPGTYLFCLHSRITDSNVSNRTFRAYFGFRNPPDEHWSYPEDLYTDSYVAQLGVTTPAHELHTQFIYEADVTTLVEVKYNIIGTGETVTAKIGASSLYVIRLNDGTGATRR